jgi:dTMP kinase
MAAKYICIEGVEGVGKTTQTQKLVDYLQSKGYSVLQTKEPGTPLSPVTMELRNIMLNKAYDDSLTTIARELISQAIRSIHIEKIINKADQEYDFIIQDRGVLSGLAYGNACGNYLDTLEDLSDMATAGSNRCYGANGFYNMYDYVIFLSSDKVEEKLNIAKSAKQEFAEGDAIEAKGPEFMLRVNKNMNEFAEWFETVKIDVDGKNIEAVFSEILKTIGE